jgi:hypothetical protein
MNTESILNNLLKIALNASDVIPGMSDLKPDIQFALGLLPEAEAAYTYFQSPKGQTAIRQLNSFLSYVQSPDGQEAISHVRNVIASAQSQKV